MILCTQNNNDFNLYKKDIDNKKVRFKIQVIFSKWWPIFLNTYKHLNIRPVVLDNIDRMINCKNGNLSFHIFKWHECNKTLNVARPVMAESRIIDFDGTYVTFWYQKHEDDKIVIEKIHALEFISRLIIHIPDNMCEYP